MQRFLETNVDLKTMSPLTLAFIGDEVYGLFVREYLVTKGNTSVKKLHSRSVEMVRCEFQSMIVKEFLFDIFTDEEKDIYTRGRNAKVGHIPKNANAAEYHSATGLECLFGYLYLKGELIRLKVFFEIIVKKWEKNS